MINLRRKFSTIYFSIKFFFTQLPKGFDPNTYLLLNNDVEASGVDPKLHYLRYGRHEKRIFSLEDLKFGDGYNYDRSKNTILIVSHEASLTGAPILSLNLVENMIVKYNIVVLLLSGGEIYESFLNSGAAVLKIPEFKIPESRYRESYIQLVVNKLCHNYDFKFAIVNSIASSSVLSFLSFNFIVTVSLIHEFVSYTRPISIFKDAYFWATKSIFSTKLTAQNFVDSFSEFNSAVLDILPQGKCDVPKIEHDFQKKWMDENEVLELFRANRSDGDIVLILGVGLVQYRKGVDLFIECASRVIEDRSGANCRFIWIGNGYDPEFDINYSVYLEDQLKRAGLRNRVTFVNQTTAIEIAYREADLLIISSRLDPLPNVALDAMSLGLCTLCFDKTTGISEFLKENGLEDQCVARYLDTADMANKIIKLASSKKLREELGEKLKKSASLNFDLENYIDKVELYAIDACKSNTLEKLNFDLILKSNKFRQDFYRSPQILNISDRNMIRLYLRSWITKTSLRKPMPGFNPYIYADFNDTADNDPFAHFLQAGLPRGPWLNEVINLDAADSSYELVGKVALHLHVYYVDLLPDMLARLSVNRVCPDLYISVPNKKVKASVIDLLKKYEFSRVDVRVVPNKGRDIAPFITEFGKEIFNRYDYVGHLHTKKSVDVQDRDAILIWNEFLMKNLLGDGLSIRSADIILEWMDKDIGLGMVFPDDPNVLGWGKNEKFAVDLVDKLEIPDIPQNFNFPVGTMFWARSSALKPLFDLNLDWDDYPIEPLPYDGSLLHAIERILPFVIKKSGFKYATTNLSGVTR